MKNIRLSTLFVLVLLPLLLRAQAPKPVELTNDTGTGTSVYHLVKYSGVRTVVNMGTADTAGAVALCIANCGTSGQGLFITRGLGLCQFDGATTAKDYVIISPTVGADCRDYGSSQPSNGQIVGVVLDTISSTGTALIDFWGAGSAIAGGDITAKYILGAADGTLTNSVVNSDEYYGPNAEPASPSSYNDEFNENTGAGSLPSGSWSWVNQGSATVNTGKGLMSLNLPSVGGASAQLVVESTPSNPWQFDMKVLYSSEENNFIRLGVACRESSTGKFIQLSISDDGTTGATHASVYQWASATSQGSQVGSNLEWPYNKAGTMYFRIKDDGTNLIFSISMDGNDWTQVASQGRTSFMAGGPNQIGFFANNLSGNSSNSHLSADWIRRTI